ncbi:protein ATP1B4 isoform X2 [Spea bombifrons]|uniref:protein ATP1B4 isoform X2 n=1 Tax=Spea bombifrons TaxID=233779 RepID=UPI0023494DA3|nr:protein ATP1B4 isoform X2 [Spea bombifrons]XP_053329748.1 protein ATP1B4 isoform X2 [Spea bombifrons]
MNSSTQRSADEPENWTAGTQRNSQEPSLHRQMAEGKTWADWCQGLKVFIWNPEKREFLGRNGKSWALISLFYFLLYSFLTGMFALCIYGLLLTINPYVPTYRDRVFPPGVTIRPHVADFHFSFSASESSTWSSYAENLNTFLEAYNDDIQIVNNIECTPGQYFIQAGDEKEEKKACQFRRSQLKNCSGIEDPTFGFSEGKPCFLLKMNRIVGYKAGSGVPIYVTCEVPRGNHTHLGSVNFYPTNEYDLMYYPFYGKLTHVNYTSPIIAMHFTEVIRNEDVTIQCKINGKQIINDHKNDRFLGRIIFTLHIR